VYIRVTWDPLKAAENYRKHGISFADAEPVIDDPHSITFMDNRWDEERFMTIGRDLLDRILVIVYTYPTRIQDEIRFISARRATPLERRRYDGKKD
jgi:hypothetical protein